MGMRRFADQRKVDFNGCTLPENGPPVSIAEEYIK